MPAGRCPSVSTPHDVGWGGTWHSRGPRDTCRAAPEQGGGPAVAGNGALLQGPAPRPALPAAALSVPQFPSPPQVKIGSLVLGVPPRRALKMIK